MAPGYSLELRAQISAGDGGIGHQLFPIEHREHREGRGGGHGTAAEGGKEAMLRLEGLDQGAIGDHHSHGIAVRDRLAQGHDVRPQAAPFETPKMRAAAAQTVLNLVGDHESARGAQDSGQPRLWIKLHPMCLSDPAPSLVVDSRRQCLVERARPPHVQRLQPVTDDSCRSQ